MSSCLSNLCLITKNRVAVVVCLLQEEEAEYKTNTEPYGAPILSRVSGPSADMGFIIAYLHPLPAHPIIDEAGEDRCQKAGRV